jgi:hypothetical protein
MKSFFWTMLCVALFCVGFVHQSAVALSTIPGRTTTTAASTDTRSKNALKYLSDLPTPSLVLDLQAIEKIRGSSFFADNIPPLTIGDDWILEPAARSRQPEERADDEQPPLLLPESLDELIRQGEAKGADVCFGYIHAKVVQSRYNSGEDDGQEETSSYLAKLDLPTSTTSDGMVADVDAHLVLGLNNHHVGSYYWARSAGGGAAMEAPGVVLRGGNRLEWASHNYKDCNSNDGKRSKWVNFLKGNDQVQLRPKFLSASVVRMFRDHVYGITGAKRPLGAEPVVVCRFDAIERRQRQRPR